MRDRRSRMVSTGSVYVDKAIADGSDCGILWIDNSQGRYIGFMHDAAETPSRMEAIAATEKIALARGMDVLEGEGSLSKAQAEKASWEVIPQSAVYERFGTYPDRSGMILDEGAHLDRYTKAFRCDEDVLSEEARAAHATAARRALAAGLLTAGLLMAVFALSAAFVAAYGTAETIPLGMVTLWSTAFGILGVAYFIRIIGLVSKRIYGLLVEHR